MPTANVSLEETESMYFQSWQLASAFVHPAAHGGDVGLCVLMDCLLILHPNKDQVEYLLKLHPRHIKVKRAAYWSSESLTTSLVHVGTLIYNHSVVCTGTLDLTRLGHHTPTLRQHLLYCITYCMTTPTVVLPLCLADFSYFTLYMFSATSSNVQFTIWG